MAGAARALVDRGVLQCPVDRQAEPAQQRLEDLLVGLDEFVAQLEEVRPGDGDRPVVLRRLTAERRLEALDIGLARIAADAVVVLDAPLRRQTVVVPAHRVEDLLAGHALVAGDRVGVGVAEHVAHVQRAADGGRRCVDREDVGPLGGAVERVDLVGFPYLGPTRLDAIERGSVRDVRHSPEATDAPPPARSPFASGFLRTGPQKSRRKRGPEDPVRQVAGAETGVARRMAGCAAPLRHCDSLRA